MFGSSEFEYFHSILAVRTYLRAFLFSPAIENRQEYYEPIVVQYQYAKLCHAFRRLNEPLRNILSSTPQEEERLLNVLEKGRQTWKTPLEHACGYTALSLCGRKYTIPESILSQSSVSCRFYRQRHPHRIFGSPLLTRILCEEARWHTESEEQRIPFEKIAHTIADHQS